MDITNMTAVINSNKATLKESTNRSFENAKSMVISVLVVVTVLMVTCLELHPPPTSSSYPKEVGKLQSRSPVEEGQVCCESNEVLRMEDREQLPHKALEES